MHNRYLWNGILVKPDDLIALAWSAPMRDLAAKIGMSDVGLRKLLTSYGTVLPPQGHWNRVHAGRKVPSPPKARARQPGERGRLYVDSRFGPFVARSEPMSSAGPFATAAVPEDLDDLYAQELKAIGRATVPSTLDLAHPGILGILRKEAARRDKAARDQWYSHWDEEKFAGPLDQRKLRLLNGLFLALAKRGHDGSLHESDESIGISTTIGDTSISVRLEIVGKHGVETIRGYRRPARSLPASTPLALSVGLGFGQETGRTWKDDDDGKLETKVATIAASLIVAGEDQFRRDLREAEVRAERDRLEREEAERRRQAEAERQRIARLAEMQRQRIAELYRSGELMRQANDIRALIPQVRAAVAGMDGVDDATIDAWERWALDAADQLDPVKSGQVLLHVRVSELDGTND